VGREGWAWVGGNTKADGTGTAYFPASWRITTGYDGSDEMSPIRGDLLQRNTVTFEDSDITLYAIWDICWIDILNDEENKLSAVINWHTDTTVARQGLTIPSQINSIPVTAILPWAFMQCLVKNLFISKSGFNTPPLWGVNLGVRGICSPAYANISRRNPQCPAALRRGFFIPYTITSIGIGTGAFAFTNNLETITLSENITSIEIGEFAFSNTNVYRITLGAGVDFKFPENAWFPDWLTDFIQYYNVGGKKAGIYEYQSILEETSGYYVMVWTLTE
jgi:hypothetical protein